MTKTKVHNPFATINRLEWAIAMTRAVTRAVKGQKEHVTRAESDKNEKALFGENTGLDVLFRLHGDLLGGNTTEYRVLDGR